MEIDKELVNRARKQDPEAFAKLYGMICQDLYHFALYTLGNQQDAEDAVSETVMSAFQQIARLRKPESFRSWMFQILVNQCKRRKKEYLNKSLPLEDDYFEPAPDREEICDLHRAMNQLEKEERMVVSLSVLGGYSSREIGSLMKMNANTVRTKRSKAFGKLRELLIVVCIVVMCGLCGYVGAGNAPEEKANPEMEVILWKI